MAFSLGALIVDLEARTGKFETDMGRAAAIMKKRTAEIDRAVNKYTTRVAKYVAVAVAGLAALIIKNTKEADAALAQLDAAVKSTGGAAGFTTPQLVAMSKALQGTTVFADDAVQAMQSVLLTFTRIKGPEFEAAQQAIVDISSRLGKDLQSSAILVGKALNDPIKGMAALSKAGIQFSESQTKAIKSMVALNDLAGAQKIILGELQAKFGGAAAAARDTFGGALEGLKNAFGDLFEVSAEGTNQAKDSILGLTSALQDPSVIRGIQLLTASIVTLIGKIGEAIAGLTILFTGKGGNAAVNLDIQIDKTKRELDNLLLTFGLLDKTRAEQDAHFRKMFGEAFSTTRPVKELERLRAEYDKLIAKQLEAEKHVTLINSGAHGGQRGGAAETDRIIAAGKAAAAGAQEATEAFEKQSKSLEKQIAMFGKIGEAAKVSYDIESGALEDMHPAEQQHILALAQQYDWLVKQAKAVEDLEKEYEQLGNTTLANRNAIDSSRLEQPLIQGGGDVELGGVQILNSETTELHKRIQEIGDDVIKIDGAFFEVNDSAKSFTATLKDESLRQTFTAISDLIYGMGEGMDDFAKSAIDAFRRILANKITEQLFELFASIIPGLVGGGASLGAGAYAPGAGGVGPYIPRAGGGPVWGGNSYMVGERGPEKFVPRVSGSIVPNNALGGIVLNYAPAIHVDSRADRAAARQDMIAITQEGSRRMLAHLQDQRSRGR